MTKLCPRGKAAAKRKFRVYPSAYANAYASKICAGKIKDPSGVKRKDFKGPKPAGKVSGGEAKIKKVIGGLKKASRTHAAQAKTLQSVVKASSGKFAQTLEPYTGTYIKGNLAGHEVSNKSYKSYYKGMLDD
jgi:hypothetical protein|tara:strand:+ start:250 stop:645 length:396 start_codon:yes stop_codon:yes gene_type:complete